MTTGEFNSSPRCPKCKAKVFSEDVVCPKCGADLE
ncbi:MAG: zinc ribbon domain-containing protein [archaeon]